MNCVVLSLAMAMAVAPVAAPPSALRVGMIDTEGSATAEQDAALVANYFGKVMGRPVTAKVYKEYGQLAADFTTERVDLAWLPPALTVPAIVAGATLIAKVVRGNSASYLSVVFARADSPITDLHKVKKASIAWVDRSSAAGFVFPGAAMVKDKVPVRQALGKQSFLGNHRAVCEAVLKGDAQLGATFANPAGPGKPLEPTGCVLAFGPEVSAKLKILLSSGAIPSDALATRPGTAPVLVKQLTEVALGMATTPDGRDVLAKVFHADRLATASEADYEPVAAALEAAGRIPKSK